jgi:hypothetical protein
MPNAQSKFVLEQAEDITPHNTKLADGPKMKEFKAFCKALYAPLAFLEAVDEEKLFIFLLYQSFRPKQKQKKRRVFVRI